MIITRCKKVWMKKLNKKKIILLMNEQILSIRLMNIVKI